MSAVGADLVSPPVQLHQLLAGWQFGDWTADVALCLQVASAAMYLWGVRRLAARGRRWSPWRVAAFLSGLATLFVALVSGLASYDNSVFTMDVIQHLLLMMVAPPLLSLGAPITLALQSGSRSVQTGLLRVLHSHPVVLLTAPLVAGGLYYTSMWADMESSFYPYSLTHPLIHDASHVVLFGLGCLFWWPATGVDRLPRQPNLGVRLAALGLGMPFESFLAIALMSAKQSFAPQETVTDLHNGGQVFWVGAMAITALAAGTVAWRWLAAEERAATRPGRSASATGATALTADPDAWATAWLARTGSVPTMVSETPQVGG